MNEATLQVITEELAGILVGCKFGKIFQLSRLQMAIDFRLRDDRYLFVSVEPSAPRIYLIQRRLKELEKQSQNSTGFTLFLRKRLANSILTKVQKDKNERILRFFFNAQDEIEGWKKYSLVVQLTGRSANIFLLDQNSFVLDSIRETHGDGQENGGIYSAPERDKVFIKTKPEEVFSQGDFLTLSESLDAYFREAESERKFQQQAKAAREKFKKEISKSEKLRVNMLGDLRLHGDAEKWKRYGDLLLANLATAAREGNTVLVVDYFDDDAPTVEIEVDANQTLTEAAENFFKRYTKARNAKTEIEKRLKILETEISNLREKQLEIEQSINEKDAAFLSSIVGEKSIGEQAKSKNKKTDEWTGARRYLSSDGFEILVGKASKDNDYLTFRVAKSLDLWLHAADYAGSHVVVRNPNRSEVPPKTLLEAAQLAAFFSQGKTQPKAAVNYTEKKFVNKPKGAVAGLVSLSSFKTILVEPKVTLENLAKR